MGKAASLSTGVLMTFKTFDLLSITKPPDVSAVLQNSRTSRVHHSDST
jgi:hypothetical protein